MSGNPGASFDKNRVPSSPIAAEQHAALLTIDTACHGLRGATGAIVCFAGGGTMIRLFHMIRLSICGARIAPAAKVKSTTHGLPLPLNFWASARIVPPTLVAPQRSAARVARPLANSCGRCILASPQGDLYSGG